MREPFNKRLSSHIYHFFLSCVCSLYGNHAFICNPIFKNLFERIFHFKTVYQSYLFPLPVFALIG